MTGDLLSQHKAHCAPRTRAALGQITACRRMSITLHFSPLLLPIPQKKQPKMLTSPYRAVTDIKFEYEALRATDWS
eukprot:1160523-Pelagomonas_calceolata.AAC.5